MRWLLAIFVVFCASSLSAIIPPFGQVVVRLADKLPVLLAVLLAAVFVRLARGMPTIPYEKVAPSRARTATRAFRALVSAYVHTFWIFVTAIILNLLVSLLKPEEAAAMPAWLMPSVLTAVDGLVIVSIIFLIMSDVALARTQADMMDEVTTAGEQSEARKTGENVKRAFRDSELPRVRSTDETSNGA